MTVFPNKTTVPAPGVNKQTGLPLLNILLAILLAATMLSLPGAHPIHIVSGIFMLIGCGIHLVLHRHWIKVVILETPRNITPALRHQRRLFWGMFISGSLCGLSGLSGLITLPLVHAPHVFLPLHCCGTPIHILSGLAFCGFNIHHLVLHRNWFTKNWQSFLRRPSETNYRNQ